MTQVEEVPLFDPFTQEECAKASTAEHRTVQPTTGSSLDDSVPGRILLDGSTTVAEPGFLPYLSSPVLVATRCHICRVGSTARGFSLRALVRALRPP